MSPVSDRPAYPCIPHHTVPSACAELRATLVASRATGTTASGVYLSMSVQESSSAYGSVASERLYRTPRALNTTQGSAAVWCFIGA